MHHWRAILLLSLFVSTTALAEEKANTLSLPPASLAKWYPPQNERKVWLHTMFGLRRSMQAVTEYNALGEKALANKWAQRFAESYKKLPQMVPEWRDEVELKQADKLLAAAAKGDSEGVNSALHRIGTTCRSCHNENRAMVGLIYGTPDYHTVSVESSETMEEEAYPKVMERLGLLMNRVKIAQEDERHEVAQTAGSAFIAGVKDLANSCKACHQDSGPRESIFSAKIDHALEQMATGLEQHDRKRTDEALGTVGAYACGRCHSLHKGAAELRHSLLPHQH